MSQKNDAFQAIVNPILSDLNVVNEMITREMHSDVALADQVSQYLINAGGKRIRPVLELLIARSLGYTGVKHHAMATTIEFVHTSTLLHDDVVDEADLRRGTPSANASFGNSTSILVGDFLYTRALQIMVRLGNLRVLQVMADAANLIAEGEVQQLSNARDVNLTEAGYMQVIYAKTAKLFEASAMAGAIIAGATEEQITAAGEYGKALGLAFQIADDMLDYVGNTQTTGKEIGNDLKEGKMTLPLIYVMQQGSVEQQQAIRQCIVDSNQSCFETVIQSVTSCGGLTYANQRAQEVATLAKQALECFPNSQYKQSLLELASFAVERHY